MNRRLFLAAGATATASAFETTQKKTNSLIELRYYKLRNTSDGMPKRLNDDLANRYLPALQKQGIKQVGFFGNLIGAASPYVLQVTEFKNLAQLEASWEIAAALDYVRMETSLLRSFDGLPALEMPAVEAGRAPRVFELRTYESNNFRTLGKKAGMFNNGEIAIFRKTGLNPVFFGETIFGANQPNLTYMLWYDSLAAREANWKKFVTHPEWDRLKSTPGLSDAEIVSNISNSMLNPLAYSPIK
ncbi:NIPSNAP family protein [Bryobacter aggregatus]|uniref:NIPSNAP family protein n=1 Tax=Bryobacter aggregatus TaxID=360054 RepID=UPI0004E192AA|nr:NIPSNAP family protein [Bryobacter aggregatus]